MEQTENLLGALEALLFASGEPVSAERLAEAMGISAPACRSQLELLEQELAQQNRGLMLLKLDKQYQLTIKPAYGAQAEALLGARRNTPLSQAALEVLSVVAYNGPVSRAFIEQVRGVDSSSVVASLVDKGLLEEAGRLDLPGRPISYRTTAAFLRIFSLQSLAQLPPLRTEEDEQSEEPSGDGEQKENPFSSLASDMDSPTRVYEPARTAAEGNPPEGD